MPAKLYKIYQSLRKGSFAPTKHERISSGAMDIEKITHEVESSCLIDIHILNCWVSKTQTCPSQRL